MNLVIAHRWMPVLALLALATCLAMPNAVRADPADPPHITIYRCTDTQGRLALRDTPCLPGERQETTAMQRPQDPPPRPLSLAQSPASTPVSTGQSATAPPQEPARVYAPPTAVYRCTTPDGEQYTSESPDGNPRWVPLWTLGYPVIVGPGYDRFPGGYPSPPVRPAGHAPHGAIVSQPPAVGSTPRFVFDSVGRPPPKPSYSQPGVPDRLPIGGVVQGPGTWVRDGCTRIPQAEVCGDLRDRRTALVRRYNSALQSERREIDSEKRWIDQRLEQDCAR